MMPGKLELEKAEGIKSGLDYKITPPFTLLAKDIGEGEIIKVKMSISCFSNQEEKCPKEEWFSFSPKEFELTKENPSQVIRAKLDIPRDDSNPSGSYKGIIIASPQVVLETVSKSGATSRFQPELGSVIRFKKTGKVGWGQLFKIKWENGLASLSASLNSIGLSQNAIMAILLISVLGLAGERVYSRRKKKRH